MPGPVLRIRQGGGRGGGGQGKETCLGGGRFVGGFISGNTLYFRPPTALYLCSFKQMFDRWLIRQATFCSWVMPAFSVHIIRNTSC